MIHYINKLKDKSQMKGVREGISGSGMCKGPEEGGQIFQYLENFRVRKNEDGDAEGARRSQAYPLS